MTTRRLIATVICVCSSAIALAASDPPIATIRGTVAYSDGAPVAGAVIGYRYSTSPVKSYQTAKTDARGRYEMPHVAAEGFDADPNSDGDPFASGATLQIESAPGIPRLSLPMPLDFQVRPGQILTKDLTLRRSLKLAGKVMDETTGKPVPGVQLFVSSDNSDTDGIASGTPRSVISAADGTFQADAPSGSRVEIMVVPIGAAVTFDEEWSEDNPLAMAPFTIRRLTTDKTDIVIRVRLVETATFTGKLVDSSGQPVAEAMVSAGAGQMAQSGSDGTFTLALPANRPAEIFANNGQQAGILSTAPGQHEGTLTLRDKTDRQCMITTPDGTPAGNLQFSYRPAMQGWGRYTMAGSATTDAQGKCAMTGLITGVRYEIDWTTGNDANRDYDNGAAVVDLGTLKEDEPVRFTANQYTNALMGKVVDSHGKAIAGAEVFANHSPLLRTDRRTEDLAATTSGADGSFELGMLGSGVIDLLITADGYRPTIFQSRTDSIDFVAAMAGTEGKFQRRVLILDPDGKPLHDVPVQIITQNKLITAMKTDAAGTADLSAIAVDATALIVCDVPGYAYGLAGFNGGIAGTLRLTLQKPLEAWKVRLLDEQDKPLPGAVISLAETDQVTPGLLPQQSLKTLMEQSRAADPSILSWKSDAAGMAMIGRMPAGRYVQIAVQRPNGGVTTRLLSEPANGRTVTIRVARPATLTGRLIGPDDKPVTGLKAAQIMLTGRQHYQSQIVGGMFSITGIEPGTYQPAIFSASTDERYALEENQQRFDITPGQVLSLDLKAHPMLWIRGRLDPAGTGNQPMIATMGPGGEWQFGEVGPGGAFQIAVDGPGQYALQYQYQAAEDRQMIQAQTVTVTAGQNLEGIVVRLRSTASRPATTTTAADLAPAPRPRAVPSPVTE